MNKISLYGLSAVLALAFAACDGYEEPNPAPQTNPQSTVLNASNVKFTYALPATANLEGLAANGEMLKVATLSADSVAPGYTFLVKTVATTTYSWTVDGTAESKTVSFEVPAKADLVSGEGTDSLRYVISVDPAVLSGLYQKNVSYNPAPASVTLSSLVYCSNEAGGEVACVGNPANALVSDAFTLEPIELLQLEEEYYLVPGNNLAEAVKMTHLISNDGQDIYANPEFQIIYTCPKDFEWSIVPASVYAAGSIGDADYSVWGPNAASATLAEGKLIARKGDVKPATAKFEGDASYQLTVNFIDGTFSFVPAISTLWLPGNQQSWNPATASTIITNDFINFWGYVYLDGQFKFCGQPDWNPYNWGAGAEEGTLKAGGDNLNAEKAGLYEVKVNLSALTYTTTLINSWAVIGNATPGGGDTETKLTPNDDFTIWTGQIKLGSGEFKFRANDGWDINLGGDMNNLSPGGANIPAPGEEKVYTITLDLTQYPYCCTVE